MPPLSMKSHIILSGILAAIMIGAALVANFVAVSGSQFRTLPIQGDAVYDVPCEQAGIIERLEYKTYIYDYSGAAKGEQQKYCYVYLPFGYTRARAYNILYLLHGGGENAEQCMLDEGMNCTKNMVDQMIFRSEIEPLIIVMPSFNFYNDCLHPANRYTARNTRGHAGYIEVARIFQYELKNELVPAVEKEYSTYAGFDTSGASLTASRDHRAFAGLSRGSITTIKSVLCNCLAWFGSFAPFSGTDIAAGDVLECLNSREYASYPVHELFFATGSLDHCYAETKLLYLDLKDTGRFESIHFCCVPYQTHYDYQWPIDLYNALPYLFRYQ